MVQSDIPPHGIPPQDIPDLGLYQFKKLLHRPALKWKIIRGYHLAKNHQMLSW